MERTRQRRHWAMGWAFALGTAALAAGGSSRADDDKWARFADKVAATEALSPAEQQKKFHLPPGFRIELVAAEPDVRKPMNLNFDAAGRLWATQSTDYPYP
ncbi:MAG: DUF7133 domain-containing protein, partial [Planctomycetia bacterium]